MSVKTNVQPIADNKVSTGAGIAIAGVWLATTGLTIIMLMIQFVWGAPINIDTSKHTDEAIYWAFMIVLFIFALPTIAAYYVTKLILSKD